MRTIFLAMTFAASGVAPAILARWLGPMSASATSATMPAAVTPAPSATMPPAPAAATPAPSMPAAPVEADEPRPRIIWELTTFAQHAAEHAAEPPPVILEPVEAEAPLTLDTPAVVWATPQMATPQMPAPAVSYAPAPEASRVVSVTYGEPFIVSDSRVPMSYPQAPMTYSAPAPAMSYPQMPMSYGAPAAYSGMPGQTYADGSMPGGSGNPSIYIDAHSTLEHGPRFGIGNGLFRSGRTERGGNTRSGGRGLFGGGGLFGRRGGYSGTSYDLGSTYAAPMVCGPGGCY